MNECISGQARAASAGCNDAVGGAKWSFEDIRFQLTEVLESLQSRTALHADFMVAWARARAGLLGSSGWNEREFYAELHVRRKRERLASGEQVYMPGAGLNDCSGSRDKGVENA